MKQPPISKEMQCHELTEYWSEELPEKVYLYYEDEEISFKTLNQRVNSAAWHFRSLGIQKGDRVGIFMVNSPDFLYAWFGLNKIGAVMVPVNTGFLAEAYAGRPAAHYPAVVPHECPDHVGNGVSFFWSQPDNAYRFQSRYLLAADQPL